MAGSRISRFFALVAFSAVAIASTVSDGLGAIGRHVARMARNVVDVFAVESPFHPGQAPQKEQGVALVMAKAFKRRIEGRNRPTVTPRWRMCPSA